MQTPDNTERYMVTQRGAKSAILLGTLRVFDTVTDAIDYARAEKHWYRIFMVSNNKRPKEITWSL